MPDTPKLILPDIPGLRNIDTYVANGGYGEAMKQNFRPSGEGVEYSVEMTVHKGAGAYIVGEEMAMMSSLEGGRGYPRYKPPFPAVSGLWGMPTTINNIETMANVPVIMKMGAD